MAKSKTETTIEAGARAAGKPPGALDKDKPSLAAKGPAPKKQPKPKG